MSEIRILKELIEDVKSINKSWVSLLREIREEKESKQKEAA